MLDQHKPKQSHGPNKGLHPLWDGFELKGQERHQQAVGSIASTVFLVTVMGMLVALNKKAGSWVLEGLHKSQIDPVSVAGRRNCLAKVFCIWSAQLELWPAPGNECRLFPKKPCFEAVCAFRAPCSNQICYPVSNHHVGWKVQVDPPNFQQPDALVFSLFLPEAIKVHSSTSQHACLDQILQLDVAKAQASYPADKDWRLNPFQELAGLFEPKRGLSFRVAQCF